MRTTNLWQPNIYRILLSTRLKGSQASEQGLTLIECLAGIVVASIILGLMAPVFLLSAATRIQNRRAEQAMEIAQSEVDRARALVTRGVKQAKEEDYLPPQASGKLPEVATPSTTISESSNPTSLNQAREVDIDEDGDPDFLVQTFRDEGIRFNTSGINNQLAIFQMGIRVYSIVAKENLQANELEKQQASLTLTSASGSQQTRPLSVLYTEISRSDIDTSLTKLRDYLSEE